MKIILVRHGETEENFLCHIQGRKNDLLNDGGRRQCKRLKSKLNDKKIDACYMSPLVRCVETAMILIGERVEMISDQRLIDREMGDLEGKNKQEYNAYRFWDYDLNWDKFHVEPIQDVFMRCSDFLNDILEHHENDTVIVVTHSVPYRAIRHLIQGTELKGNLLDGFIDNCQCEEFEYQKKKSS